MRLGKHPAQEIGDALEVELAIERDFAKAQRFAYVGLMSRMLLSIGLFDRFEQSGGSQFFHARSIAHA